MSNTSMEMEQLEKLKLLKIMVIITAEFLILSQTIAFSQQLF